MVRILCALAVLLAAGALPLGLLLVLRARALKARHLRFAGQPVPPPDELGLEAERLVDAPRALWHGTRFADGQALFAPAYADACVGDLFCTAQAIFLRREEGGPAGGKLVALPLAWVTDASLHRAHAALAGKELPMLRLRWRRGGEELLTDVSMRGGMAQLERLRRELHLRQGQGDMLAQLRKFVEATKVPGAGAGTGSGPGPQGGTP